MTGRDFDSFRPGVRRTDGDRGRGVDRRCTNGPLHPGGGGPDGLRGGERGAAPADDDLPRGIVPAGSGLLQIGAPASARVLVDGVDVGSGPLSSSAQRAGYHQVRIDQDGKNSQYVIEVRAGKTTRVKSSPLP